MHALTLSTYRLAARIFGEAVGRNAFSVLYALLVAITTLGGFLAIIGLSTEILTIGIFVAGICWFLCFLLIDRRKAITKYLVARLKKASGNSSVLKISTMGSVFPASAIYAGTYRPPRVTPLA